MQALHTLSVIIPVGPGEAAWPILLTDLALLPSDAEIILAATTDSPANFEATVHASEVRCPVTWIQAEVGRARQLNEGARRAKGAYLWFLHADSRLSETALTALERALAKTRGEALCYFDLRFDPGGPCLMPLNTMGVWMRSHCLGLPFGDQGFCLATRLFQTLGTFDEQAAFGEDDLLVRAARRRGVRLYATGATISTSPRKYQDHGWLKTTATHLGLTLARSLRRA